MRILVLLAAIAWALSAQPVRAVAGEAPRAGTAPAAAPQAAIVSSTTTPALAFPIQPWIDEAGEVRLTIPPATPPGEYRVEVRLSKGSLVREVTVQPVTFPRTATASVPVVLLNGWQFSCPTNPESTVAASAGTFGQMATLLQRDGASVSFFNNCVYRTAQSIPTNEALAEQLDVYLSNLRYTDGSAVEQVDLVAHSMGGLIARAYLAGMRPSGAYAPPAVHKVRKLVMIATPNFGSMQAVRFPGPQTDQMVPATTFLWRLNTWNQNADDLRGVDALAILGNGGTHLGQGRDDGVVSLTAGSLAFARPETRTRVVRYCHITPGFLTSLGMTCDAFRGIADIDNESHLTARIVRSFLADTVEWTQLGQTPSQDPVLSQFGGVYLGVSIHAGNYLQDLTSATAGSTVLTAGLPGVSFYHDLLTGSPALRAVSTSRGTVECGSAPIVPGRYRIVPCKQGPAITHVTPLRGDTPGAVVASGGTIVVHGSGFGAQQCAECVLEAGATPLAVSSWTAEAIAAVLPASVSGAVFLTVRLPNGSDNIQIVAAPGAPPAGPPVISSVVNGASFFAGIQSNAWVAIKGVGLAATTRIWDPSRDFSGDRLPTALDGVRVSINGRAAAVYYISPSQINVLAPADTSLGNVTVIVTNDTGVSRPFFADLQSASPAFFTFDARGGRYLAAVHVDGTYLGPAGLYGAALTTRPARPGDTILLFGTGCGATSPAVPADVIFAGAAPLTSTASVTIGGQAATVAFAGMSGNGLCQYNVVVPPLADGDHLVVATIAGRSTQPGVHLAVAR